MLLLLLTTEPESLEVIPVSPLLVGVFLGVLEGDVFAEFTGIFVFIVDLLVLSSGLLKEVDLCCFHGNVCSIRFL